MGTVRQDTAHIRTKDLAFELARRRRALQARQAKGITQVGPTELAVLEAVGEKDQSTRDLSDWIGCSVVAVQGALRRLKRKGLVQMTARCPAPHHGATKAGHERLTHELTRGRVPGVSSASTGLKQWPEARP